jgi:hypothetical protein
MMIVSGEDDVMELSPRYYDSEYFAM